MYVMMSNLTEQILADAKKLNSPDFIDGTYYRRNMAIYELVTYINHIIACHSSNNYESMAVFTNRAQQFLNKSTFQESEYLLLAQSYLNKIRTYLKEELNNDNVTILLSE